MTTLYDLLTDLTVPCTDDGRGFIRTERLSRIQSALQMSSYRLFGAMPLAYVYRHRGYSSEKPTILVSTHIDSVYDEYFARRSDRELHGTFDNSAGNAVALYLMLEQRLPAQVLVAFTGNEEEDSIGVDQVMQILQERGASLGNLELVITLDLTDESFGKSHYTIENYFVGKRNGESLLKFARKRELKRYLKDILEQPKFIKNAEADESWQYDEHDLNCFSLCLPCRARGEDMHDDRGVAISAESFCQYADVLERVAVKISDDLKGRCGVDR